MSVRLYVPIPNTLTWTSVKETDYEALVKDEEISSNAKTLTLQATSPPTAPSSSSSLSSPPPTNNDDNDETENENGNGNENEPQEEETEEHNDDDGNVESDENDNQDDTTDDDEDDDEADDDDDDDNLKQDENNGNAALSFATSEYLNQLTQLKLQPQSKENKIQVLKLRNLRLHQWQPLANWCLQANVTELRLDNCHLTPKGAQVLSQLLSSLASSDCDQSSLQQQQPEETEPTTTTEEQEEEEEANEDANKDNNNAGTSGLIKLYMRSMMGSSSWCRGLVENKSLRDVEFDELGTSARFIWPYILKFIYSSPSLKHASLRTVWGQAVQDSHKPRKLLQQIIDSAEDNNNIENPLSLETLELRFTDAPLSSLVCRVWSKIFERATNLRELELECPIIDHGVVSENDQQQNDNNQLPAENQTDNRDNEENDDEVEDAPIDFLQHALSVQSLRLNSLHCQPAVIAHLMTQGNLRKLELLNLDQNGGNDNCHFRQQLLSHPNHVETIDKFRRLLNEIDISRLEVLKLSLDEDDGALPCLIEQLRQNRGPEHLNISLTWKIRFRPQVQQQQHRRRLQQEQQQQNELPQVAVIALDQAQHELPPPRRDDNDEDNPANQDDDNMPVAALAEDQDHALAAARVVEEEDDDHYDDHYDDDHYDDDDYYDDEDYDDEDYYDSDDYYDDEEDDYDVLIHLARSLRHNSHIQNLRISTNMDCSIVYGRFIEAMGTMPNLHTWNIWTTSQIRRSCATLMMRHVKRNSTLRHVGKGWHLDAPQVEAYLQQRNHCRSLLSHDNTISDGIWSHVFCQVRDLDLLYELICELPNLVITS